MQSKINSEAALRRNTFKVSNYMVYIVFICTLVIFAIWEGWTFFSVTNLLNITRQTAMISVMAVAATFVIASGQIDLSIGSTVALTSLVVALILESTGSIVLAVGTGVLLGAGIGLANGFLVTKVGIPSFLATLGMQSIIKGTAMWSTNTAAIPIFNETYNFAFGVGSVGVVPTLLFWTIAALLIGHYALNYTGYGKKALAIGGNITSAKYTGINVRKMTTLVFMYSGIAASIAGMLYTGRMQTARYTFGEGDELNVIAAVILGGTSMSGGNGSVIGAVIGSLLMGVINNGLIIGGLNVAQQTIVRGAIIIMAVGISMVSMRRSKAQ